MDFEDKRSEDTSPESTNINKSSSNNSCNILKILFQIILMKLKVIKYATTQGL